MPAATTTQRASATGRSRVVRPKRIRRRTRAEILDLPSDPVELVDSGAELRPEEAAALGMLQARLAREGVRLSRAS